MSRWLTWALVLATLGALALRLPRLDRRPLHTDESVHAIKFKGLWEQGTYRYDPNEFHGPSLYYLTWPFVWASGAKSFADSTFIPYRMVPAFFGVGLVLLLFLARDALGKTGTMVAALFTAVSPAMVFYSRYYIHEIPFVFFTMLALVAGWRYHQKPGFGWAALFGLGVGLMYASKETFVISLAAMGMALVAMWVWGTIMDGFAFEWRDHLRPTHILVALLVAAVVGVVLFTSFFTNSAGLADSFNTYLPWFSRAKGNSPHIHGWFYYLDLLTWRHSGRGPIWSEAIVLVLALVGLVSALKRVPLAGSLTGAAPEDGGEHGTPIPSEPNPWWFRFIAFYALFMTLAYAAIPYKTPWCLLGFYHGLILLAGMGFAVLWHSAYGALSRGALITVVLAGAAHLGVQSVQANGEYCADIRNPYVYAHTGTDLMRLVRKVENLAQLHPDKQRMLTWVIAKGSEQFPAAGDYWPLPWYFRKMERVGYTNRVPENPRAPVIIASPEFEPALAKFMGTNYQSAGFYGHRPRPAVFLMLFVRKDLWDKYMASPKLGEDEE